MSKNCFSCQIQKNGINKDYLVYESDNFIVEQDFDIDKEAYIVIVSKRHISKISEFNEIEETEFIELLKRVREGIEIIYGINFALLTQKEKTNGHFHFCIFPETYIPNKIKVKIKRILRIKKKIDNRNLRKFLENKITTANNV